MKSLDETEQVALMVATDTYEAVRRSPALDAPDHWDRFANRLKSAAFAQTAPAYMEQVSKRFGVPHTPGDGLEVLLLMPQDIQREVLRKIRTRANALSVLVRAERKKTK